jgi:hypothetical protein
VDVAGVGDGVEDVVSVVVFDTLLKLILLAGLLAKSWFGTWYVCFKIRIALWVSFMYNNSSMRRSICQVPPVEKKALLFSRAC